MQSAHNFPRHGSEAFQGNFPWRWWSFSGQVSSVPNWLPFSSGVRRETGYYARLLKTCFHRFTTAAAARIFMHNTRHGKCFESQPQSSKMEKLEKLGKAGKTADGQRQWQATDNRRNIIYNDAGRWPAEKRKFSTTTTTRDYTVKMAGKQKLLLL